MNEGNQIVLYEGSPLERIASTAILNRNVGLVKASRFFLGSDVFESQYRIKGFLLMDTKPEDRRVTYENPEWTGIPYHEDNLSLLEYRTMDEPERSIQLAHFLNTKNGFKVFRYFILPENVYQLFANQRFLGEPMIRQTVMHTLPDEFDEEFTDFNYAFVFTHYYQEHEQINSDHASLAALITAIHQESANYNRGGQDVDMSGWGSYGHRAFVSFHPWALYEPVRQTGEASIVQALANFDTFLSRGTVRHDILSRDLPIGNANLYLPPGTK